MVDVCRDWLDACSIVCRDWLDACWFDGVGEEMVGFVGCGGWLNAC